MVSWGWGLWFEVHGSVDKITQVSSDTATSGLMASLLGWKVSFPGTKTLAWPQPHTGPLQVCPRARKRTGVHLILLSLPLRESWLD